MKTFIQNAKVNDTVYASVHMSAGEYQELRKYMNTDAAALHVTFPHGVRLVKRGFGWYRLEALNTNRACDKINFAMRVLKLFTKAQAKAAEAITDFQLKALAPIMVNPNMRIAAYTDGQLVYATERTPQQKLDATVVAIETKAAAGLSQAGVSNLAALASNFGKQLRVRK